MQLERGVYGGLSQTDSTRGSPLPQITSCQTGSKRTYLLSSGLHCVLPSPTSPGLSHPHAHPAQMHWLQGFISLGQPLVLSKHELTSHSPLARSVLPHTGQQDDLVLFQEQKNPWLPQQTLFKSTFLGMSAD